MVCRFTFDIDEAVRAKTIHKGDLSLIIEEAIALAELATMDVIVLRPGRNTAGEDNNKLVDATTVLLSAQAVAKIIKASKDRKISRNSVINSAVNWWLNNAAHSMTRR